MTDAARLLARLERFYDAVPRGRATVESIGPFSLFVPIGAGHPFYARPDASGAAGATAADVTAVRERQRALGLPEAFEWVHDLNPRLRPVVAAGGLAILDAPLMVLDGGAARDGDPPSPAADAAIRVLRADDPTFAADLAAYGAVARIGFANPGTAVGADGAAERDEAVGRQNEQQVALAADRVRAGVAGYVVADDPLAGIVAGGGYQAADGVAEIVGVATLPAARRQGLAAAVTAALATAALAAGCDLVFLSAADADVARMYGRLGFRRIGTACIAEALA